MPAAKKTEAEIALQRQLDETREQLSSLQRQIREQHISSLPADQRSQASVMAQLEEEREALAAERSQLNNAARIITAKELALNTGLPEDEFLKFDSITDMKDFANERILAAFDDPAAAQVFLSRIQAAAAKAGQGGAPPAPGAGDPPPAAGATTPPASAQQQAGSQAAPKPDVTAELLTRQDIGKGSGNLEGFLASYLPQTDFEMVSLSRDSQPVAPTPEPPATTGEQTPAAPAAAPAA